MDAWAWTAVILVLIALAYFTQTSLAFSRAFVLGFDPEGRLTANLQERNRQQAQLEGQIRQIQKMELVGRFAGGRYRLVLGRRGMRGRCRP